jgi:peptide/nickel transport system ATP-binding protein
MVDLTDVARILRSYPHQLSGGQQQRVLIALAMAGNPDLLILDEPTTGLDVTTEARILELIGRIQRETGTAVLLITHNLGIVRRFCRRVTVIYAGDIVEAGPVEDVLERPAHPYTRALLDCIPPVDSHLTRADLPAIGGALPDRTRMPDGCLFAPRCPRVSEPCRTDVPDLRLVMSERRARCLVAEEQLASRSPPPAAQPTPAATGDVDRREALLVVENLGVTYAGDGRPVKAVDGIDLHCGPGEVLGIVGESGCGKTSLARCIAGLLAPSRGRILFDGGDLTGDGLRRPQPLRRRIQMVFQNPENTLNPQHTVERCLSRPIALFGLATPGRRRDRVVELLDSVQLGSHFLTRYPHELSGGERQRVAIARAFATEPDLVICDEPISSLDASIQAGVLNLLQNLQRRNRIGFVFISHDLNVVRHVSDRIAVMYGGRLCEVGTPSELFAPPYHPYTEALLAAAPVIQTGIRQRRIELPRAGLEAAGGPLPACPFAGRCPHQVGPVCIEEPPPDRSTRPGRHLFCHLPPDRLDAMEPVFVRSSS